ncbi:hypothetical protein VUN82_05975 [Micrococcaceae bacterium Sec5.1]
MMFSPSLTSAVSCGSVTLAMATASGTTTHRAVVLSDVAAEDEVVTSPKE